MALQILRGTTAQLAAYTPAVGELVYNTDTGQVVIGDGSTIGGTAVIDNEGFKTIAVTGESSVAATTVEDTLTLVGGRNIEILTNPGTKTITINADLTIGATFEGDVTGSIFADNSTLLVDAVNGRIVGPVFANVTGNVTGNVSGNVTGNLTGNADTATTATNANNVAVSADGTNSAFYLTFVSNNTGNNAVKVDGELTYNPSTNALSVGSVSATTVSTTTVNASTIDTLDSSAITIVPAVTMNSDLTVQNTLRSTSALSTTGLVDFNIELGNRVNILLNNPGATTSTENVLNLKSIMSGISGSGNGVSFTVESELEGIFEIGRIFGFNDNGVGSFNFEVRNSVGATAIPLSFNSDYVVVDARLSLVAPVPNSSIGADGDVPGLFAFDNTSIYYCTASYDGVSDIWVKQDWGTTGSW